MRLGGISERRPFSCSSDNWNPMTGNRSFIKPSAQTKLKGYTGLILCAGWLSVWLTVYVNIGVRSAFSPKPSRFIWWLKILSNNLWRWLIKRKYKFWILDDLFVLHELAHKVSVSSGPYIMNRWPDWYGTNGIWIETPCDQLYDYVFQQMLFRAEVPVKWNKRDMNRWAVGLNI